MTTSKPDVQALIERAREWVQEENWESDSETDGTNAPGTELIVELTEALSALSGETETELNQAVANAVVRGFNKGYAQADREWRQSGDGRGLA